MAAKVEVQFEEEVCSTCQNAITAASNKPLERVYHSSYADLCRSAEQGCNFCGVLRQGATYELDHQKQNVPHLEQTNPRVLLLGFDNYVIETDESAPGGYKLGVYLGDWHSARDGMRTFSKHDPRTFIPQIRHWISNCINGHVRCRNAPKLSARSNQKHEDEAGRPTRLVYVGERLQDGNWSNPKLHIPKSDQKYDYLALSYQWGVDHHQCCTNESTINTFLDTGMPWDIIPRTIQDAISVTRELGYSYIWIDALCIIQEASHSDWASQVPYIGSYYENAVVTLSAVDALSCNEGFLHLRPEHKYPFSPCEFSLIYPDGRSIRYMVYQPVPHYYSIGYSSPLYGRGWALQERIFSPRTVFFGKHCIAWYCPLYDAYEWEGGQIRLRREECWNRQYDIRCWIGCSPRRELFIGRWFDIVETYSAMSLSRESDRLPAIASIVRAFEGDITPKPRYITGLWEETLPQGLCWYAYGHGWIRRDSGEFNNATVPSWSWISAKKRVEFLADEKPDARFIKSSQDHNGLTKVQIQTKLSPISLFQGTEEFRCRMDEEKNEGFMPGNGEQWTLALLSTCPSTEDPRIIGRYIGLILEKMPDIPTSPESIGTYRRVGLADLIAYKASKRVWEGSGRPEPNWSDLLNTKKVILDLV